MNEDSKWVNELKMKFLTTPPFWGQSRLQTQTGQRVYAKSDPIFCVTGNYFGGLTITQGKEMQRQLSNTGHDTSKTHFSRTCQWGRDTTWLMQSRFAQWVSARTENRIQDPQLLKISFSWQLLFPNLLSLPCRNGAPRGFIKIELIRLIKSIQLRKNKFPIAFSVHSAIVNFLLTSFRYWTQLNQTTFFIHLKNYS